MILETVSDGELAMIAIVAVAVIGGAFALINKTKLVAKLKARKENKQ